MNIPHLDEHYDELCTFSNIEYTPAWYYKKFPGFYNVECYKILAAWNQGVRDENKKRKIDSVEQEESSLLEEGVEETKGEDGVHS